MSDEMPDVDVVVVGGGISGLSAARELCRAGLTVRLVERERRCGGVIRTDVVDGFVIDAGPDTLLGHKPAALTLCRDLDLGDSLVSPLAPRTTYVVRRGRLRALPETSAMGLPVEWRTLVTSSAFSWLGKARMACEPFLPARSTPDESIASFIGRRFGSEAVSYLAEPLLAGLHRGDAGRLSIRALFPTLAEAERVHGSVIRSWRKGARAPAGRAGSMSLKRGLGQLVERLEASLPAGVVVSGAEVRRVERQGPFTTWLADERTIRSRAVILAIPAPAAGAVVAPVDAELARLCGAIRYAPSLSVALGYRRTSVPHPLRGWGALVPGCERRHLAAVSWVTSKWPGRAPPDHVLIRASLHRLRTDDGMHASDDEVRQWAQQDLRDLLGVHDDPVTAKVYRLPAAMPQLEVGHLARMASIERRLPQVPGLFISAAGFRGVGLPDCVNDAKTTAGCAISYLTRTGSPKSMEVCAS